MKHRRLGPQGPLVSAIGYGCMGLSGGYGAVDPADAIAAVRYALEVGVTLLDTADFYGAGGNEQILGRALAGRRDRAFVATKIGVKLGADGRPSITDGSPAHLAAACDASLIRLGLDAVDLLILCRVDRNVPIEDSVGALARLVEAGKARHVGLSEASAATIRRAAAVHPITAVETEYSLWERHVEASILPALDELGIGLLAYSPLGRGFLAGPVPAAESLPHGDVRHHQPRFEAANAARNRRLAEALAAFAAARGRTAAQIALAWLLARGPHLVPIPGSRRPARIDENAAAAEVTLTAEDLAELDALFPPGAAAGARYAPAVLAKIDGHGG